MPDLREELGRLADFVGARGSFRDLVRARRRRARRRRTSGLVAGVAVFIGAAVFLATTLQHRPAATPGDSATPTTVRPSVATVWPESAINGKSADETQTAVDAGEQDVQWRTQPDQVISRFVRQILGSDIVRMRTDHQGGSLIADVTLCVTTASVDGSCDVRSGEPLEIHLTQPAGQGERGIWSVESVGSPPLAITLVAASGEPISEGDEVAFGVADLPVAASAHVGIVASNGCNVVHVSDDLTAVGQRTLRVRNVGEAAQECAAQPGGYAFAYVTDDTTLPVPDPLEYPTAIEAPWLTILPFTMSPDALVIVTPTPQPDAGTTAGPSSADVVNCDPTRPGIVEEGLQLSGCTEWAAGTRLQLTFENRDEDVVEGLALFEPRLCSDSDHCADGATWKGELITGPGSMVGQIEPLKPGVYMLIDAVHPDTANLEIIVK
jgi:hypothetical protein